MKSKSLGKSGEMEEREQRENQRWKRFHCHRHICLMVVVVVVVVVCPRFPSHWIPFTSQSWSNVLNRLQLGESGAFCCRLVSVPVRGYPFSIQLCLVLRNFFATIFCVAAA